MLSCVALAQSPPPPIVFGQVPAADLTVTPFAADSAAAAVVLCDYGTASIVGDDAEHHKVRFDRTTRIKILTKAGLAQANVEVLLRHESAGYAERIASLEGFTYNLVAGKVVREALPKNSIFTDRAAAWYSLQKFALPNVRVGSVVEYHYTIISDYMLNLRPWQFQGSLPVRWSEFRAEMPHQFTYKVFLQQSHPLAVDEHSPPEALEPHFRWAMRQVPPLVLEPFMTTPSDYVDEVTFELANYYTQDITRSWEQIDYQIIHDPNLGQQLDQHGFLKDDLARLPAAPAAARLAAVRALVSAAVRCTGQRGLWATASLRHIYEDTHQGSVADVNLLLIAALRAAGFAAQPVLLSTRAHGRVRTTLPQRSQFDYLAAYVPLPNGPLVMDATDPLLPYDMLPVRCLNQQARLVLPRPDTSRWLALTPRHRAVHLQRVSLRLAATGAFSGEIHEEFGGYAGAAARAELRALGEGKYGARVATRRPDLHLTAPTIANRDSLARPLLLDYTFSKPAEDGAAPATIYFSPLRGFAPGENPLRAESLAYPVDFAFAQEETVVLTLTLPAGYELVEVPKSKALDLTDNGGRYVCSTTANGSTVVITSRLTLRKPVYPAGQYGALRELYRQMLEKQAEKLVIKRKARG